MTEVAVLGSFRTIPKKLAYAAYLDRLDGELWDVEHYRKPAIGPRMQQPVYDHFAVAVDRVGRAWIGVARCSWRDQYVRSVGHALAVSRALAQMARAHGHWPERQNWRNGNGVIMPAFSVPVTKQRDEKGNYVLLNGVALRDYCRQQLERLEVM